MKLWRRDEVAIGQRWTTEDGTSIWEVVAIIERPVVVLRPVSMRGSAGSIPDIHHVIDSDAFGRWRKVRLEGPS